MKTKDNSFAGFPGCWNMLAIVIFALKPESWITLTIVLILVAAMFTPLKFIHPVRTERWRSLSLPMALAWTGFAGWAAWSNFAAGTLPHAGLMITSLYLIFAGIAQQIIPPRRRHA